MPNIHAQIKGLKFTKRQASWVAAAGNNFYKVFRGSRDLISDLDDPACIEAARKECAEAELLHSVDSLAIRPKRRELACLVYPRLSGPDLHSFLKGNANPQLVDTCLSKSIALLARFHLSGVQSPGISIKNYESFSFLRTNNEIISEINQQERTFTIAGFEVRNLRYEHAMQEWYFFDPHHVSMGCREEDFARFVISLLMMNWQRSLKCRIWQRFTFTRLISHYEYNSGVELNRLLLCHFLREAVAMRQHYARQAVRVMRPPVATAAQAYMLLYFHQVNRWIDGATDGL